MIWRFSDPSGGAEYWKCFVKQAKNPQWRQDQQEVPNSFVYQLLARVHFLFFEVCKVINAFYDMTSARRKLNMIARWLFNGRDREGLLKVNVIDVGEAESIGRNQLIIWLAEHTWFIQISVVFIPIICI